uniref:Uncharacterized protein Mb2253c family n=1 Tax=Cajanus cajan TaxID=3821 RepID=A0A151R4I5_CAJCA|nr:Uncharacterized protein Mb2253c family [Cajanus cajan]
MIAWSVELSEYAINNQAEYEALLTGLTLAKDIGVKRLKCCSDSKLIAEQVGGGYQTKEPQLQRYNLMVSQLTSFFDNFQIEHIPRAQNERADLLSKLASTKCPVAPSCQVTTIFASNSYQQGWMADIWKYLKDGILPDNKVEASKIKNKSCHFTIEADELFKRGFSMPLLKCLDTDQANYVMDEIHRGICGMHSGARSMAARVIRAGYYWPTMRSDYKSYV